ncbi:MAG: hypothetical protein U9Q69_04225 [Nanoarchaeota archaeon]|nr:hypothetical protein [Nanoarchaeota archaeon]
MNEKDLLVVSALRNNSRQTLSRMSREIRVPLSTIHDRIKGLKGGIIRKHTSIVDFSQIGFYTRAFVLLKVKKEERNKLQEVLQSCSHINCLAKINNGFDFMVEMIFEHIKDMEDYLESLEQKFLFENKNLFYIVDDIKREDFLSNPKVAKMIVKGPKSFINSRPNLI